MAMTTLQVLILLFLPCCNAWSTWLGNSVAAAALATTISVTDPQEDLIKSLKAPTEDTPQIVLPQGAIQEENAPLVQGLVYLTKPQRVQPLPSDMLLVTVRDFEAPDDVLAGAKIPVSRIRFPLNFAMSERNVVLGKSLSDKDLLVKARLCPSDTPCSDEEASLKAEGIAKLLKNLPGSEGTSIRVGASLGLQ